MREALAASVGTSQMGMEADYEHAADRIAAMAFGPRLGSLLIRYRDANQHRWEREAVAMIAHRVVRAYKISQQLGLAVARCALIEWSQPQCSTCRGARELMGAWLKVVCHECAGSGVRRYTDVERHRVIGAWGGRVASGYDLALATITDAVMATTGVTRAQLERNKI